MYNNIDITWSVQFAHVISGTESLYPNKCIGWGTERELDCLDLSVGSLKRLSASLTVYDGALGGLLCHGLSHESSRLEKNPSVHHFLL